MLLQSRELFTDYYNYKTCTLINFTYIQVSDAESEWHGGTAICKALNPDAEMASFHSQAESIFVANKYSTIHAWTGLSQTVRRFFL